MIETRHHLVLEQGIEYKALHILSMDSTTKLNTCLQLPLVLPLRNLRFLYDDSIHSFVWEQFSSIVSLKEE